MAGRRIFDLSGETLSRLREHRGHRPTERRGSLETYADLAPGRRADPLPGSGRSWARPRAPDEALKVLERARFSEALFAIFPAALLRARRFQRLPTVYRHPVLRSGPATSCVEDDRRLSTGARPVLRSAVALLTSRSSTGCESVEPTTVTGSSWMKAAAALAVVQHVGMRHRARRGASSAKRSLKRRRSRAGRRSAGR
jgi:hypothetical protein